MSEGVQGDKRSNNNLGNGPPNTPPSRWDRNKKRAEQKGYFAVHLDRNLTREEIETATVALAESFGCSESEVACGGRGTPSMGVTSFFIHDPKGAVRLKVGDGVELAMGGETLRATPERVRGQPDALGIIGSTNLSIPDVKTALTEDGFKGIGVRRKATGGMVLLDVKDETNRRNILASDLMVKTGNKIKGYRVIEIAHPKPKRNGQGGGRQEYTTRRYTDGRPVTKAALSKQTRGNGGNPWKMPPNGIRNNKPGRSNPTAVEEGNQSDIIATLCQLVAILVKNLSPDALDDKEKEMLKLIDIIRPNQETTNTAPRISNEEDSDRVPENSAMDIDDRDEDEFPPLNGQSTNKAAADPPLAKTGPKPVKVALTARKSGTGRRP